MEWAREASVRWKPRPYVWCAWERARGDSLPHSCQHCFRNTVVCILYILLSSLLLLLSFAFLRLDRRVRVGRTAGYGTRKRGKRKRKEKRIKKRSTGPSRVVPHRSTTPARTCLTSLFGWEAVSQADIDKGVA